MKLSSIQDMETDRLAALHQLQILDTSSEEDFDDIVALSAQICETPISTIAFEDNKRIWFKAKVGVDFVEIPRDNAFCSNRMTGGAPIVITDTHEDELFTDNPLVSGETGVRFFAGIPLIDDDGYTLGYLCVMDRIPRNLNNNQISGLITLAKQVVILLKLRLKIIRLKKSEEEAHNSNQQVNTIFHNSIVGVFVTDEKGKILQWNPKAEAIFGWKAEEATGEYFPEIFIPERFRSQQLSRMSAYEEGSEPLLNSTIEIKALRKDRSEIDIEFGTSPAIINGQRYFISFVSNITDRVLATRKLDEQKEFYENILNKLPADIAVFDANHKYLFVNPGGIKDPELRKYIIGKDDFEYAEYRNRDKSVAQVRREQFMEIKKTGKEIRWEDTIKAPDGNPITHLRRIFPVHNEKGALSLVIGFGVDITDRKVMEEKQTALVNQLSAQNTQLIDFCNIVSHNLRAPLVNMSMLVKFIEESRDNEEQMMLISKLQPVIENLHITFNELVESIQIKQDHEIKSESIDLADTLQRTINGLKIEINKSQAIITTDFTEASKIYFPAKYLLSIFHNLLSNALKYQSPKRKPVIQIATHLDKNSIILSVKDNGLGIDMTKHRDNLFKIGKIFHHHPNAKGFGLFMTRTQVEAMGGRIWVESHPDEGSAFFIEFKNQLN